MKKNILIVCVKEDSGNYTCTLPHTNISSTVQIQILKGKQTSVHCTLYTVH